MRHTFRGNKNFPFWFLVILAALGLLWMAAPALLGFSASQMVRWGQVRHIPAVLDEWWMERTGGGRITMTQDDGSKTVIFTRNGKPIRVSTLGSDGEENHDCAAAKRDLHNWQKFEDIVKAGGSG